MKGNMRFTVSVPKVAPPITGTMLLMCRQIRIAFTPVITAPGTYTYSVWPAAPDARMLKQRSRSHLP